MEGRSSALHYRLRSSRGGGEGRDERDVRSLGVRGGKALDGAPRVPLGLALEVKHTRGRRVHVANSRLGRGRGSAEIRDGNN